MIQSIRHRQSFVRLILAIFLSAMFKPAGAFHPSAPTGMIPRLSHRHASKNLVTSSCSTKNLRSTYSQLSPLVYPKQKIKTTTTTNTLLAVSSFSSPTGQSSLLVAWILAMVGFFLRNYQKSTMTRQPWPVSLSTGSRRGWNLVHIVSTTLFSGTIVLSTVLEWFVLRSQSLSVWKFWFVQTIPILDTVIVLPALTGAMVSGLAQSIQEYQSLAEAPKYVKAVLHTLATFGLWWALTDHLTTQAGARQAIIELAPNAAATSTTTLLSLSSSSSMALTVVPRILYWRRASNLISCLFVAALYILMVLKPGRPDLPPVR